MYVYIILGGIMDSPRYDVGICGYRSQDSDKKKTTDFPFLPSSPARKAWELYDVSRPWVDLEAGNAGKRWCSPIVKCLLFLKCLLVYEKNAL